MPLASFEDANAHLDGTKISFADEEDALEEATSADREVKAALGDRFPDHVGLWADSPSGDEIDTPELVREAASLLMASKLYEKKYSEESVDSPNVYAQTLRMRAEKLLAAIADGSMILWDVDYGSIVATSNSLEQEDFWPNDTYTREKIKFEQDLLNDPDSRDLQPTHAFGMDQRF